MSLGPAAPSRVLQVQPYNVTASTASPPCQQPAALMRQVQLPFCLVTDTSAVAVEAQLGTGYPQSADTFRTVSYGIFSANSSVFSPLTYSITSLLQAFQYTNTNATPSLLSRLDGSVVLYGQLGPGSAPASISYSGIALSSAYATFSLYDRDAVLCANASAVCGRYGQLTVRLYNASAGGVPLPCSPAVSQAALLSFCLVTSTAYQFSSPTTFRTVSYVVFSAVTSAITPGVYIATAILNGSQYTSTDSTPTALSLLPPGAVPGLTFVPDDVFTLNLQLGPGLYTALASSNGLRAVLLPSNSALPFSNRHLSS